MNRTLSVTIHWKAVEQYFVDVFTQIVILENLSILHLALAGAEELSREDISCDIYTEYMQVI